MAVMGPELPGSPERTLDQSLRGNLSTDPVWQSFIFVYVFSFFFLIKKKETCIFTGYVILGKSFTHSHLAKSPIKRELYRQLLVSFR